MDACQKLSYRFPETMNMNISKKQRMKFFTITKLIFFFLSILIKRENGHKIKDCYRKITIVGQIGKIKEVDLTQDYIKRV